ncbi:hypothetical protein [Paenibacillus sp. cl123]|uniref:hypothetical protein n=1 Tax=unclassified Paenibacillus TaxID=185978 RepID=UPI003524C506
MAVAFALGVVEPCGSGIGGGGIHGLALTEQGTLYGIADPRRKGKWAAGLKHVQ